MARNLCLVATGCLLVLAPSAAVSDSASIDKRHALALIGEPEYGPGFTHFKWVNPDAPKGGRVRLMAFGTFDSLNPYAIKGNAPKSVPIIYDRLMLTSPDEPAASYGLVAEWVAYPDDVSSATFQLRPTARFHDGKPITPEDVIFSLEALRKAHPRWAEYWKNVVKAEKVGERQVRFTFDVTGNRELPIILGQLPVLPRHFWEATGSNGEPRDLSKSTLEVPLGSGPYRIKEVDAGRAIVYERVEDWWAKDLPVVRGQWNFDEIRLVYFRDVVPAFEAFKAGQLDYWEELSSKNWATHYGFDAIRRGLVKREKVPVAEVAPMQGFVFNQRRPQFQDARVRRAFNLAFDFEWANKNLLYDEYQRVDSYFGNSELKAQGLPQGLELELLKEVRAEVPPEVFTTVWKNPVNRTPDDARSHLAMAAKLIAEAGYRLKDGVLTNAAGVQLKVEFLNLRPEFERMIMAYQRELEKLGIKVSVRTVDSSQYQSRVRKFDFDIITRTFPQSASPGNEQREFWGSETAGKTGSHNVIGIRNSAVDKLIDRIVLAKDRAELVAATCALDRVLLWNHYVVPQFHAPFDRIAMWDMYGRPGKLPARGAAFLQTWWLDQEKARKLSDARG
jgi:microcin C transport system substrate-binding protein